jgi:predicted Ser/Thr protein kinase
MQIPQLLGDYEIGDKIGAGSMGTVYRARRRALQKDVAVKILHPQWTADPEVAARFETEATSAACIDHVNTVRVLDYGQQDGIFFIAMEFIEGLNLKELLRLVGPPRHEIAVLILRDLCRGLEAAHEKGVIHRDIKPENLAITSRGEVKIMDFGLARRTGHDSGVTIQGTVMGTAAYMSPEQALGKNVDQRSDIFSLGLVAYELFSGTRAFPGDTYGQVLHRVLTEDPVALSDLVPDLNPDVLSVIEDMIRKDLNGRCQDISEARDRLEAVVRDLHLHREDKLLQELVAGARPAAADETTIRPGIARRLGTEGLATSGTTASSGVAAVPGSQAERPAATTQVHRIEITPPAARLRIGESTRLSAHGVGRDGARSDLSESVHWQSDNPALVAVDADGVASARQPGESRIVATYGGVSASMEVLVAPALEAEVEVEAESQGVSGLAPVHAKRAKPPVRLLPVVGIILLIAAAAVGGRLFYSRAKEPVTPTPRPHPKLLSVDIDPASVELPPGGTTEFSATGTFEGDSAASLTDGVAWSSGDSSVAVIDEAGMASAVGPGETAITAAAGMVSGKARLIVQSRELSDLRIEPTNDKASVGETVRFKAWGSYSDGSEEEDVTGSADWEVRDPGLAGLVGKGIVRANSAGLCRVRASLGGKAAEARLAVNQVPAKHDYFIVMRPQNDFRYVRIDEDPKQYTTEEATFDCQLTEGNHRFRIVTKSGEEITLTYQVRPGDPNDKLILDYDKHLVDPGRR